MKIVLCDQCVGQIQHHEPRMQSKRVYLDAETRQPVEVDDTLHPECLGAFIADHPELLGGQALPDAA